MNERKMYASTHTHWEDQFDSDYDIDKACKRFKELGAEGFCLTQHGVLSGVEPMREKAAEYGLKFVPGIETYYGNEDDLRQNQHLILLAKNYDGYRAIWKAVSDKRSQNTQGRSVMNLDIIKEYFGEGSEGHGNVIATSACINGVIATTLRANDIAHSEIEKLQRKAEKYTGGREKAEYFQKIVNDITSELLSKDKKKGALEKYANQKFAKREKAVEKLKNLGDPAYEEELAELNADKAIAASAADELKELKEDIATTKRRLSANNKSLKAAQEDAERESFYDKQIKKIEATMKSDQQLFEAACNAATLFLSVFGNGNFYMEVQNHGIDTEREIYPVLVKVAREVGIPLIAANDIHTVDNSKEELLKRQIIRSLRFGTWEEKSVGDDQLYIKADEELAEWLSRILNADAVTEAMNNIKVVFDQCNVEFPEEKHYPVFPSVEGKTSEQVLYDEICRGVKWRFGGFDKLPEGYRDRLKYEFKIITSMGYSDYHLIVKDFLEYGRALGPVPTEEIDNAPFDIKELNEWTKMHGWEGGFTIGPGRGSAVGSLVCYCLGITSLDPIKYNLLFERFLNPERVSMPDIDSDIAKRIRPKVIDYVRHKYGEDAVCGIMTTNAQAPRGTIRIAAKYYSQSIGRDGEFLALGDKMAKMVPNTPGISFDSNYENTSKTVYEHLKYEYANNQDALTILDWARIIEGCFTTYGAHAAGVVISDGAPVMNYIPLRWNEKLGEMTTQVDMNRVESKGLIKMDFLGLKTLDIITDCIRMIQKHKGITIDPLNIPMDDPKVFSEIFQRGRTNSVFQFESNGMKNMLKRFKPDSFEDLIILVSMFRPGPLQYLDGVIDVKNGVKPVSFLCPELKPILGKTYGAIVYQEQVMEIFQKLAGYTLGGADQVRRFMSKKKMDKLVHEREAFIHGDAERGINGCVARGIAEDVADKLFDEMTDFAKYAFNKSHAAAYAANSYYTAWLKLYYPAEFLAAALNWAETDKYTGLINEAKSFGVNVLIPDINRSYSDFTTTHDGNILFGLAGIKTVGSGAESIIEEREKNGPYVSLIDFFKRCDAKKDAVQNLMRAGAFDSFCKNRASMISVVETYKEAIKKCTAKEVSLHNMEAMLPYVTELDTEEKLKNKMAELNIPAATISSVTTSVKLQARIDNAKKALTELSGAVENITLPEVEENYLERLNAERELLGVYVSQHPIGEYERGSSSVSIADGIAEGSEAKREIMGVITSIKRKTNRKGEPIAFLDVEDETSSVNVCVYAPSYRSCSSYLSEGNVLIFTGRFSEDQRSDDEKKYDFIVSEVRPARKMQRSILITCISEAGYKKSLHMLETRYKDPYGRKCSIYVNTTDKLYDVPFRVSAEILKYPAANEI